MKIDQLNSASSIHKFNQNRQGQGEIRTQSKHDNHNEQNKEKFAESDIKQAVDSLNGFIEPLQTNLKFVYHDELNEYYVTVVNPLTNEVLREIPPKKMLDMYAAMTETMGILIDEKI